MEIKDKINKDLREKILNLKAHTSSKFWLSLANIGEFLEKEFKEDHKEEFTILFESDEWKNQQEYDCNYCNDKGAKYCLDCGADFNIFCDVINDYLNSHIEERNIINDILVENNKEDNLSSYYWELHETYPNLSYSSQDKTLIYTFKGSKGSNKAIITIDDNLIPINKQFGFHPTIGKLIRNLIEALDKEGYRIDGDVEYHIYYDERLNMVDWDAEGVENIPACLLVI